MTKFSGKAGRIGGLALIGLMLAQVLTAFEGAGAVWADDVPAEAVKAFNALWEHNDRPVAEGRARRTWTWGPSPFKTISEPYADSPGGQRSVTYYDKSRMEINNPAAAKNSQWYVTNGLIVREMVAGRLQLGDNSFRDTAPAQVVVAGDPIEVNPAAPTYASFRAIASLSNDKRAAQQPASPITTRIDGNSTVSKDANLGNFNVKYAYYDQTLGHNIPDVFMNFFKSQGQVYQNGTYQNGPVLDWVFACGLPITEPYWANVKVSGKDSWVIVQLFERRVLTYNPANAPEWRVEMGNVGQHYYSWRYANSSPGPTDPAPTPAPNPSPTPIPTPAPANNSAFGSVEKIEGQDVVEIGNGAIKRTVVMGSSNGIYTASFLNRLTNSEYMGRSGPEFRLRFSHELQADSSEEEITSDSTRVTSYKWLKHSQDEQLIEIELSAQFHDSPFNIYLYYQAQAGQNFVRKWLTVPPFNGQGWAINKVIVENWNPDSNLDPLAPATRYSAQFATGQINFSEPDSVITSNTALRYNPVSNSRALALHHNGNEGFYFFQESLFGNEDFSRSEGLHLSNADFIEPEKGFSSGRSVLGVWRGPAEVGYKRYQEYLYNNYDVVKGKKDPVWFSTWYVYEAGINQEILSGVVDRMKSAGFYDLLHIDAGWEGDAPLQPDLNKFPQGLDPIIGKLNAAGMGLGLWINPFSHGYEDIANHANFRRQHPDWVNPEGTRLCPLSGAGDYVASRLVEIARSWPLDVLYWDGADWNPNSCQSSDRRWRTPNEEHILTLKYYASLINQLHAVRPNLRVVIWSAPPDVHWLGAADEIQLSDIAAPPLLQSELIRRQQNYYAAFEYSYAGTWGDWYGLQYQRDYSQGLGQPLNLLRYAEASMIGNNANQAGASFDLATAPPGLLDFLSQMFNFRKRFANYFTQYQHVLGFPDGASVDGEAHIINGQGFILLFNPTSNSKSLNLPLDEPGLELQPGVVYNLSDWSSFTSGQSLGTARTSSPPNLTIPAYGFKVIGVNIS